MATAKCVSKLDEAKFSEAIATACSFLNAQHFYRDQEDALRNLFNGKDLFFSAHTGYGKSLIYQAIPVFADVLNDQLVGTSVVLVISPLLSLMVDKLHHINKTFGSVQQRYMMPKYQKL